VLEKAFFIEDVLKNKGNPDFKLRSNLIQPREGAIGNLIDRLDFLWHTIVRPKFYYLLAFIAIILSLQLVVGELIILFNLQFSLLDLIPAGTSQYSKLALNLTTVTLLIYEALCIYYGLFNLKLTSYYELHPNQQTDPFSLLYSANILTKLTPALAFNFLNLIHLEGTAFHRMIYGSTTVIGTAGLKQVPMVGDDFQKLFPATLLVLCLCQIFDVWSRLMVCMGLDEFTFAEVVDQQKIDDGKQLAKFGKQIVKFISFLTERNDREREIMNMDGGSSSGYRYNAKYFIENP
jgi:hypothetical protein